mmetsp:Transcript_1338/g.3859  ORF Transcript_1338/g.3859 Transcript_1338/m.3859 type:complete len:223 (-) Transcript_1338:6240-6908(-)
MRPPYCASATMYRTVTQETGTPTRTVTPTCFCRNWRHASRSELLYSYGTHQPMGPNLRRSCTTLWRKACVNTKVRHFSWSIWSSSSCDTIVEYVRAMPALSPAGGSRVTLMQIWSSPMGKRGVISHVIHKRNASSISGVLRITSSSSFMYPMPKCEFCKTTQPPVKNALLFFSRATFSWPSPMETLSVGYFFFFLANSSIENDGSLPAVSRYNTGLRFDDSS